MENNTRMNEIMTEITSDYSTLKIMFDKIGKSLHQGAWGSLGYIFHDIEKKFDKYYDKVQQYKKEIEHMSEEKSNNNNYVKITNFTISGIQEIINDELKKKYLSKYTTYFKIIDTNITSFHYDKEQCEYIIYLKSHAKVGECESTSEIYTYYTRCTFNYDTFEITIFDAYGNE